MLRAGSVLTPSRFVQTAHCYVPGPFGRREGQRAGTRGFVLRETRCVHSRLPIALTRCVLGRNQMPRRGPDGAAIQRLTSRLRAGSAAASNAACLATAVRWTLAAGRTRTEATASGCHRPLRRKTIGTTRAFMSSVRTVSCRSTSSVLTSTIRSARQSGRHARTSTAPRSPKWLNDSSTLISHPASESSRTTRSCNWACLRSSRRASFGPRHLSPIVKSASIASATASSASAEMGPNLPRSTRDTVCCEVLARRATSS